MGTTRETLTSITTPDHLETRLGTLEFTDGAPHRDTVEKVYDHGDGNWIQTVPGKGYFVILRCYSPLTSFFDKTWQAGEIERVQ